jgi:hypothetical protein
MRGWLYLDDGHPLADGVVMTEKDWLIGYHDVY